MKKDYGIDLVRVFLSVKLREIGKVNFREQDTNQLKCCRKCNILKITFLSVFPFLILDAPIPFERKSASYYMIQQLLQLVWYIIFCKANT